MQHRFLVLAATYNEASNIPLLLDQLMSLRIPLHLLIVDDNSPDGTGEVADRLAKEHPFLSVLHREIRSGYADALQAGFSWAISHGYELVLNMDADLSHQPKDIPKLLEAATESDVAMGSRYVSTVSVERRALYRRLLTRFGSLYVRKLTGFPFADPTTGFRCFRRQGLMAILAGGIISEGYSIHYEMAYIAWRLGLSIKEVPISYAARASGRSKITCRIVVEALGLAWKLRWSRGPLKR